LTAKDRDTPEMIGSTISHYRILDKLGEGGMGIVYKAQDTRLERFVALKFLPQRLAEEPGAKQRFVNEAKAACAVNHPNVAVVYDVGETDIHSFIAMELVEGETLKSRLRAGQLSIGQVQTLGIQIAQGLHAAHARGIVHRDIKPDNILLTPDGSIKIMDFGIAKLGNNSSLTQTGATLGTLAYMSPEQVLGEDVDHRSDLWSLGVVLYEILNAEPAPVETQRPDTPPALRSAIQQLLQKDPTKRPASAGEVVTLLQKTSAQAHAEVPARSIAVLYFENMSSEREGDYFCAGITEDIITDLSKVSGLRVVSRTDMLPFRNKEINIRQVAEALRVNYVLEGSVRKAGNRIRITAQLISARDGYHLWADRFDGLTEDIFDFQNEVSRKIADALKISLTDSEKETLAKKPTDDLRAYDFYLRGRDYLSRRGKKNTEAAIRMFENAIKIDKDFTSAYAGLGEACAYMYEWYDGALSWLGRAIEMNREALDREPNSIEARFGIAMVYYHQGRLAEAKRTFLSVLDADPQHVLARLRLGMLVERTPGADLKDALTQYRRAAEQRPHDDDPWRLLAGLHRKLGDNRAAQDAALKVIEITAQKLEASLEDVVLLSRLAEGYARFGGKEETHATIRRVVELAPSDGLVLYNCACAHGLLGESNAAVLFLRRAFDSGFRGVVHSARVDSALESIRDHPEFLRLVAELE